MVLGLESDETGFHSLSFNDPPTTSHHGGIDLAKPCLNLGFQRSRYPQPPPPPPPLPGVPTRAYYPSPRPAPRYYPRYPKTSSRQPLRVILLVLLFAGLLLTSIALIVQFIYRSPSIVHTPVTTGLANTPVYLNATVFGGGLWVQNVTLYYNLVGQGIWKTKPMTLPPTGSQPYGAVIPGSEVISSLAYYILATNALGLSTNTVGYFILVKDFNITAQLPSLVFSAGTSNGTIVTIGSKGGFSSPITLSVSGLPSGVSASFNPPAVTPSPNGVVTSSLTLSSTTSAPAGSYTASITGTSGNLTHGYTIPVRVNPPRDFDMTVAPTSIDIARTSSAYYTVTFNARNGYVGGLALRVDGLPEGMRYYFATYQNKIGLGGTFENVTLVIVTNALSPLGENTLTITASDGTITHTAQIILNVRPEFL